MNRYNFSNTIKTKFGKQRKSTLIYPTLPVDLSTDIYIRTTSIDRLDKLALYFYEDSTLWVVIAAANNLGKGTIVVPPNTKLRIPSINNIADIITKTNQR